MKSADGHRVERGPHTAGANRQAAGMGAAVSVALSFCGDPGPCSHCYLLSPPEGPGLPSGAGRRALFCFPARGWCKALPELGPPSPDSVSGSESLGEDPWARPAQAARGAARKGGRRAGGSVCPSRQGVIKMPRMLIASAWQAGGRGGSRGLIMLPPAPSAQGAAAGGVWALS